MERIFPVILILANRIDEEDFVMEILNYSIWNILEKDRLGTSHKCGHGGIISFTVS